MAKLMIIDDEPSILKFLSGILTDKGHAVTICKSGKEALGLLAATSINLPDAILLDVAMPGLDGFTFHNLLQKNEETRKIPIIIMSGKHDILPAFLESASVAAVLEKPFGVPELVQVLEKALPKAT